MLNQTSGVTLPRAVDGALRQVSSSLNRRFLFFVVAAVVLIQIGTVASHWKDVRAGKPDFANLYESARLLHEGRRVAYDPSKIRGVDVANSSTSSVNGPSESIRQADLLHPPFEALLLYPIAFLPYIPAYLSWLAINLILFWLVPYVLWRYIPRLHVDFQYVGIFFGTGLPVLVCLVFGQDSILLLLLLTLSYCSLEAEKPLWAGVFLALGMFKFQIILPVAAGLLIFRKWRVLIGFCSALGVLLLATISILGWSVSVRYLPFIARFLIHISQESSDRTVMMPNLRGLMSLITGRYLPATSTSMVVVVLSALLYILLFIRTSKYRTRTKPSMIYSICILAASLVSYHFYVYNSVVLLLPLLLMANEFADGKISRVFGMVFAVAILAIYLAPAFSPLEVAMPMVAIASIVLFFQMLAYCEGCSRSSETKSPFGTGTH